MKVVLEPLQEHNLPRTAQLLNKTNQMNLTTRRLTEAELAAWAAEDPHALWVVRVSDRFGDAGLTGILGIAIQDDKLQIVDLSCPAGVWPPGRALDACPGSSRSPAAPVQEVVAEYRPLPRMTVFWNFFREDGHDERGDASLPLACPQHFPMAGPHTRRGLIEGNLYDR
ncbi:MAG: hypothetical protein R2864_09645 [Syntrophotaleaceae bacterium]